MADLTINTQEITEALRRNLADWKPSLEAATVGHVISIGDGVARIAGLPGTMASELLEFPGGLLGVALNLDEDSIGAVIMGEASHIQEGDPVRQTGKVLSIPVGDALLGRVVDALGNPMDGKGPLGATETRLLETQAPSVVSRQPVREPLQTGIKAIDAMTPIGSGQRQLIIGDRQLGKTAIVIDTIINQRDSGVKCIYVAIGQKSSTVAEVVQVLERAGAMAWTVVVNAPASAAPALQMYAPYSGSAIGQHWMYKGEHALVIFDDLSKQAVAYRRSRFCCAVLRAVRLTRVTCSISTAVSWSAVPSCRPETGGGSLTGLPIVETKAGDVSAYIPTNVISITDGQIYLEGDLFYSGVRPAINAGISVSRVGGNAQIKAMKSVAGTLRLNLAQFRELEAFAGFGSDLGAASQAQLARGRRVVEVLKQRQYAPVPVAGQVLSIYAVSNGLMDKVPVERIAEFELALSDYIRTRHGALLDSIETKGTLPDKAALDAAIVESVERFLGKLTCGQRRTPPDPAPHQERAIDDEDPRAMELIATSRIAGTTAGRGVAALQPQDERGDPQRRCRFRRRQAPAAGDTPDANRRGARSDLRSGPRRCLQHQRDAPRRVALDRSRPGRHRCEGLCGRQEGPLLLPLPRLSHPAGIPRRHRYAGIRRCPGGGQRADERLCRGHRRHGRGVHHQVPVGAHPDRIDMDAVADRPSAHAGRCRAVRAGRIHL